MRAACVLASLLSLSLLPHVVCAESGPQDVHILYLTDCKPYSDWQAVGMAFSFKNSGQKGKITRVMCCKEEEKRNYPKDMLEIMDTHIAPSFEYNNKTNDHYAPFNKPGAVLDFVQHGKVEADWILFIDSDMQIRHPFDPAEYNLTEGLAASADYRYMVGCTNDLAVRHIPEIGPRNDTLAGPLGRQCDEVGGWVLMKLSDVKKVAPLWLSYTVDVREDPMAWNLTGDQYVEKGGKAWISEMYGYGFGCAKANVWHVWDTELMHYPTYRPSMAASPKLTHYGLEFKAAGEKWRFDKHEHYDFDVNACPPWDTANPKKPKSGIFQHGPRVAELTSKEDPPGHYHDLMSVETVATLNAGFCDFHLNHCKPHIDLLSVCTEVVKRYIEVKAAIQEAEATLLGCLDGHTDCKKWKGLGECTKNPGYMGSACRQTCGVCAKVDTSVKAGSDGRYHGQILDPVMMPGVVELRNKLIELAKHVHGTNFSMHEKQLLMDLTGAEVKGRWAKKKDGDDDDDDDDEGEVRGKDDEDDDDDDEEAESNSYYSIKNAHLAGKLQDTKQNARVACTRRALSLDEVKWCLKAAMEGKMFKAGAPHTEEESPEEIVKNLLHRGGDAITGTQGDMFLAENLESLPHHRAVAVETWAIAHIWVVIAVAVLLFMSSRVPRFRRRAKPGTRTE